MANQRGTRGVGAVRRRPAKHGMALHESSHANKCEKVFSTAQSRQRASLLPL